MKTRKDDFGPCENQRIVEPTHTPTQGKPTPTPWSVDTMGYIRGPESENILENHANAEYVCHAVNAHEELVSIVRRLANLKGGVTATELRKVLAKAEGK